MGDVARYLHEPEDPLPAVGEADARGARGAGRDGFHGGDLPPLNGTTPREIIWWRWRWCPRGRMPGH